jgi:RNA polymerase sigma factor (sigma-70 family)
MVNELEIWREFQQGNPDAYKELYKNFASPLYSYGMKFTRDATLVEDAIHDVFCTLWTSRERLSQPTSVKNYLFKSFRNNLYKKINRPTWLVNDEQSLDFRFEWAIDEKLSQNEDLLWAKKQVEQAMGKLTSRQREIIYYRFYLALEFEEIADIMNMQVRATYKLNARALETLRNLIPDRVGLSLLLLCQLL